MLDVATVAVITAVFLIAGAVKGIIGLGLPTVSLGLLTATLDLTTAMALLVVPSFVTNIWQSMIGGNGRLILTRIWPFLLMATATVWLGAFALNHVHVSALAALLGGVLIIYATLDLAGIRVTVPARREISIGMLLGAVNGVLTGMTGSFVVPGVMFLQSIGLPRDMLIQAMGMLFTASTLALASALQVNHLLTSELITVSAAAVLPAAIGMVMGQHIRRKLPEDRFRQIFLGGIFVLGAYIIAEAALRDH